MTTVHLRRNKDKPGEARLALLLLASRRVAELRHVLDVRNVRLRSFLVRALRDIQTQNYCLVRLEFKV